MPTVDQFVVFVEEPPVISVKDGFVHIEDHSGHIIFRRVMPIRAFMDTLVRANALVAQWRVDGMDKAAKSCAPVPFTRKKRR